MLAALTPYHHLGGSGAKCLLAATMHTPCTHGQLRMRVATSRSQRGELSDLRSRMECIARSGCIGGLLAAIETDPDAVTGSKLKSSSRVPIIEPSAFLHAFQIAFEAGRLIYDQLGLSHAGLSLPAKAPTNMMSLRPTLAKPFPSPPAPFSRTANFVPGADYMKPQHTYFPSGK